MIDFLIVFFLSFVFTLLIIRISKKYKIYDYPSSRKIHKYPIPRIGGIGFLISIFISSVFLTDIFEKFTLFTIAMLIIIFEGLLDDLINLHFSQKFIFEFFCASFIFLSGFGVRTIGFDFVLHPAISFIITIVGFVGVINAFNMIDGLDGLLTILSIIIFLTFSYFFYISNDFELLKFSLCIVFSLLGFLIFNFPNAKTFMGDVGALSLGFLSASLSVFLTQSENSIVPPIIPVIILSIPIFDTIWTIIRRVLNNYPVFYSDKRHLHHILYSKFGKIKTIIILSALQVFFSLISILFYRLNEIYLWIIALFCFIILGALGYEKSYYIWFWRGRHTSSR